MLTSPGKSGESKTPPNASEVTRKGLYKAKLKVDFSIPQPVVTIAVADGPKKLTFTIHKNLICYWSPFFCAAFNSTMVEGQTQSMELDDIEGSTFGRFVNWMYTEKVEHADESQLTMLELTQLWNLGQRFIIPQLQNKAMSFILKWKIQDFNDKPLVTPFYKFYRLAFKTLETTPIRRFIIEIFAVLAYNYSGRGMKDVPSSLMATCLSVGEDMAKAFSTALVEQGLPGRGVMRKRPGVDDLADYMVPEGE